MKIGILNITSYTGLELFRMLSKHPKAEIVSVTGRSGIGKSLSSYLPNKTLTDIEITSKINQNVDLIFSCLPHKTSAETLYDFISKDIPVIDLSADFRIKNPNTYEKWYKTTHPYPNLLELAIYGLSEINRGKIKTAKLVANPGCYPTSIILPLFPIISNNIVNESASIIIDSKSGVSGSGRTPSLSNHFSEINENLIPYSLEGHRHLPEIEQEINQKNTNIPVTFVPQVLPITRGIISCCYVTLKKDLNLKPLEEKQKLVNSILEKFYENEPFITIINNPPTMKDVQGTNSCLIYPKIDNRTGILILISAIDNLIKGASGQAIQNMNIMFGFNEKLGLNTIPIYP